MYDNSRSIHISANDTISFLCMAEKHSVAYMYHIFILSSTGGYLCCFHVLAIVNSAATNIWVHISFEIMVFSRYMPSSGIVGSYGSSLFSFISNPHIVLHSSWINVHSTNSVWGFPFLHTLSAFTICRCFDDGHSDWWEVISNYSFDLHFSDEWCWAWSGTFFS